VAGLFLIGALQAGRRPANRLNAVSYINRTLSWDAELESIVASLTPAEIKAALVKHIALTKISFVKAGDFAKASAK